MYPHSTNFLFSRQESGRAYQPPGDFPSHPSIDPDSSSKARGLDPHSRKACAINRSSSRPLEKSIPRGPSPQPTPDELNRKSQKLKLLNQIYDQPDWPDSRARNQAGPARSIAQSPSGYHLLKYLSEMTSGMNHQKNSMKYCERQTMYPNHLKSFHFRNLLITRKNLILCSRR